MVASVDEIWRPVVGFETSHEVSNFGRVRTIAREYAGLHGLVRRIIPRELEQWKNRRGYPMVSLWIFNRGTQRVVHRLVAYAFLGPPPSPRHQVNHRDGAKTNNRLDNLEWVTPQENIRHAFDTGLNRGPVGELSPNSKLTAEDIRNIRRTVAEGRATHRQIEAAYGISHGQVSRIVRRHTWRHVD